MKISKFIYAAVVGGVLASCQSVDTPMFSDKDAFWLLTVSPLP